MDKGVGFAMLSRYNSLLLFNGLQLTRRLHWRTNRSFSLLGCRPAAASSSVASISGGGNLAAASGSVSRNLQFFSLWVGVILPGRDQKLAFSVKSGEVQKGAEDMESSHKYTNRLAHEHSPYLLQHAHNPVLPLLSLVLFSEIPSVCQVFSSLLGIVNILVLNFCLSLSHTCTCQNFFFSYALVCFYVSSMGFFLSQGFTLLSLWEG